MEYATRVKEIIGEKLAISPKSIRDEDHLIDDLGADSLHVVILLMALEKELDIEVATEEIVELSTVASIVELIKNKRAAALFFPECADDSAK